MRKNLPHVWDWLEKVYFEKLVMQAEILEELL